MSAPARLAGRLRAAVAAVGSVLADEIVAIYVMGCRTEIVETQSALGKRSPRRPSEIVQMRGRQAARRLAADP